MSEWTSTSLYRMESRLRDGTFLCTLPFRNLQGEFFVANRPDQIRFDLPLRHPKVTQDNLRPGISEIWLFRDDQQIYAGPLWDATPSSEEGNIACSSESLESYLETRWIITSGSSTPFKYQEPMGDMGWTWITATQTLTLGDLGIVEGIIQPSTTVQRTYHFRDGNYIFDELQKFSEAEDGIDWKILPDNRAYTVWSPRRGVVSQVRLEYGGQITGYSVQYMGKYARNDILVQGPEDNWKRASSTTSREKFGRRHWTESGSELQSLTALTEHANHVRNMRKDIRTVPNVQTRVTFNPFDNISDIQLGDTIDVVIEDGYVQIDQPMRFVGFQVTVSKQERESFNLYLNDLREVEGAGI